LKDATCPLVKRSQLLAKDFFEKGYQVVIIGDKNHSETKGIRGYTENTAIIIEDIKQIRNLPKLERVGIISQTTQNLENVNEILKELKKRVKKIKYTNTLCPEVANRQKEVPLILEKVDAILIIGSKDSANTKRLVKIAKKGRKPVWTTNSPMRLKEISRKKIKNLGVTSGTSTPNWLIKSIIKTQR
jgi:4-hydroxy-3-methylbut-2-enyl diphosphate reductase